METEIQNTISLAINTQDSPAAIRVLNMVKKDPMIEIDPQVLLQLRYVRMNSLTPEQLLDLMHDSILAAYTIPDFYLDQRISDYIEILDNVGDEIKFYHGLLNVLDKSEELLGTVNIFLKGVAVKPTIGNWIEDFSTYPSMSQEKDALAEVQYLNKSPNVKNLSESERQILKNIIKFYDTAVQRIALYDAIEVPQSQSELYKDYDLYRLIPGLEDELEEEAERKKQTAQTRLPSLDAVPTPPQQAQPQQPRPQPIPKPQPAPIPQPIPKPQPEPRRVLEPLPERPIIELPKPQPIQKPAPAPIPQSQPRPEPQRVLEPLPDQPIINLPKPQPIMKKPAKPVPMAPTVLRNMDEIVKQVSKPAEILSRPGVVKDPTNISLDEEKKRIEAEQKRKIDNIQRKLAELKSRNQPNE